MQELRASFFDIRKGDVMNERRIIGAATRDIAAGEVIDFAINPDQSLECGAIKFCSGVTISGMPLMINPGDDRMPVVCSGKVPADGPIGTIKPVCQGAW